VNAQQAKEVLLLYRPGTADAEDPAIAEALAAARRDPDLARWFEQHCAFQRALRAKLQQVEVPEHLKAALLVGPTIIRPAVWWRSPAWMAAAAAVLLLLGVIAVWLAPRRPDRFANFQERMVSTALREYRMDLVTHDMRQLRQFMAARGAPADYEVPQALERLPLTGGGQLVWRTHPVTMVCFNRGDDQMLFLFVIKRSALGDPPPELPRVSAAHDLVTVSWSHGDQTYVLAGPEEKDFVRKYL
jgi:uncharacterized membrane protein YbaN (DUF454 family)